MSFMLAPRLASWEWTSPTCCCRAAWSEKVMSVYCSTPTTGRPTPSPSMSADSNQSRGGPVCAPVELADQTGADTQVCPYFDLQTAIAHGFYRQQSPQPPLQKSCRDKSHHLDKV